MVDAGDEHAAREAAFFLQARACGYTARHPVAAIRAAIEQIHRADASLAAEAPGHGERTRTPIWGTPVVSVVPQPEPHTAPADMPIPLMRRSSVPAAPSPSRTEDSAVLELRTPASARPTPEPDTQREPDGTDPVFALRPAQSTRRRCRGHRGHDRRRADPRCAHEGSRRGHHPRAKGRPPPHDGDGAGSREAPIGGASEHHDAASNARSRSSTQPRAFDERAAVASPRRRAGARRDAGSQRSRRHRRAPHLRHADVRAKGRDHGGQARFLRRMVLQRRVRRRARVAVGADPVERAERARDGSLGYVVFGSALPDRWARRHPRLHEGGHARRRRDGRTRRHASGAHPRG